MAKAYKSAPCLPSSSALQSQPKLEVRGVRGPLCPPNHPAAPLLAPRPSSTLPLVPPSLDQPQPPINPSTPGSLPCYCIQPENSGGSLEGGGGWQGRGRIYCLLLGSLQPVLPLCTQIPTRPYSCPESLFSNLDLQYNVTDLEKIIFKCPHFLQFYAKTLPSHQEGNNHARKQQPQNEKFHKFERG